MPLKPASHSQSPAGTSVPVESDGHSTAVHVPELKVWCPAAQVAVVHWAIVLPVHSAHEDTLGTIDMSIVEHTEAIRSSPIPLLYTAAISFAVSPIP